MLAISNANSYHSHELLRPPVGPIAKPVPKSMLRLFYLMKTPADRPASARREESTPHVAPPLRVDARELFRGQRELLIVHGGREYHLRVTSNGKLILTA